LVPRLQTAIVYAAGKALTLGGHAIPVDYTLPGCLVFVYKRRHMLAGDIEDLQPDPAADREDIPYRCAL
jgi:hypothetical protein